MLGGAGALRLAGLWAASGFSYLSKESLGLSAGVPPSTILSMQQPP